MLLNSSKVIAKWTIRYSGTCLYFANSADQSAAESGGTMPMTGFHSVMERPERASRVMPPITTIRAIIAQQPKSHAATGPSLFFACPLIALPGRAVVAVVIDKARSFEIPTSGKVRPALGGDKCGAGAPPVRDRRSPVAPFPNARRAM